MLNPEVIISQINDNVSTQIETYIFICHSNLHALQALSLQKSSNDICLYNEAVSINFLKKHFKGKLFSINDQQIFSQKQLFPLRTLFNQLFNKKNNNVSIFLGNKQNFWSTFIINQLSIKHLNILDDGLSSYGISQGIYTNKSVIKKTNKTLVKCFYSLLGWTYFNEANNAEIDRHCNAYYFFPRLIDQSSAVNKIKIKDEVFHHYSKLHNKSENDELIHIASFDESKNLITDNNNESKIHYILHPRVLGKATDIPTEILLYHSNKVALGASSLILYLVFIGYKGEYILKDEESERLLAFFS